jgi:septum formation protein
MLQMLSGTTHRVHTAVAIVCRDKVLIDTSSSKVRFKTLDDSEIAAYVETGEADDKAGSYAIQGIAAQFIENIDGSFSGVMGLPIFETVRLLKQCGIDPLHSR